MIRITNRDSGNSTLLPINQTLLSFGHSQAIKEQIRKLLQNGETVKTDCYLLKEEV